MCKKIECHRLHSLTHSCLVTSLSQSEQVSNLASFSPCSRAFSYVTFQESFSIVKDELIMPIVCCNSVIQLSLAKIGRLESVPSNSIPATSRKLIAEDGGRGGRTNVGRAPLGGLQYMTST